MNCLKFGDIVLIKIAQDDFYFSAKGFVTNNLELKNIMRSE